MRRGNIWACPVDILNLIREPAVMRSLAAIMTTCTDDRVLSCVAALTFRDGGTLLQVRAEPTSSQDDDVITHYR